MVFRESLMWVKRQYTFQQSSCEVSSLMDKTFYLLNPKSNMSSLILYCQTPTNPTINLQPEAKRICALAAKRPDYDLPRSPVQHLALTSTNVNKRSWGQTSFKKEKIMKLFVNLTLATQRGIPWWSVYCLHAQEARLDRTARSSACQQRSAWHLVVHVDLAPWYPW